MSQSRRLSCLACRQARTRPDYPSELPVVVFDPKVTLPGPPTIHGTRMPAELTAELTIAAGIAEVMDDYRLTREQVLVACWWAGRYGPTALKRQLGAWSLEASHHLWYGCVRVSDPPTKAVPA